MTPFDQLATKLANRPGVTDPRALAAMIGRRKLGQPEMTRRSKHGRHHKLLHAYVKRHQ